MFRSSRSNQEKKLFDAYPSRCHDEPRIIDRLDPVIYRQSQFMALSVSDRQCYHKNGYLLVEKLFSDEEIRALRGTVDDLASSERLQGRSEVIREPSGEVRSIFEAHQFDLSLENLARSSRLLNRVKDILNSPVYIHQYRINIKRPFEGKEFYWHSDFETWHVEDGMPRMRALSCMIFMEDNNEFNGPLMVIPGSHMVYIACVGATPRDHFKLSLVEQEYGVPDHSTLTDLCLKNGLQAIQAPAGSVLFFDCNIMHGSAGNISPFGRSNLFIVYNSLDNQLAAPFCGLPSRPDYIANRTFNPIG